MLTKERKEKLLTAKKMADTISETLTPILNGTCTQAEAARKLGITPQKFSNYVNYNFIHYYRAPKLISQTDAEELLQLMETPYDKLFRDIFGIHNDNKYLIDYETSEQLDMVLEKALSKRQLRIIQCYYGIQQDRPYTLEEIAKMEMVTRERIRQMISKSLRILRNPKYHKQILVNGKSYLENIQTEETLSRLNDNLNNEIAALIENNQALKKQIKDKTELIKVLQNPNAGTQEIIDNLIAHLSNMPVEKQVHDDLLIMDMPLSIRAINCLRRHGLETLGDLRKMSVHELSCVRNLGQKTVEDILRCLYNDYNICLPQDKATIH